MIYYNYIKAVSNHDALNDHPCVPVQGNLDFVEESEEARVKDRGVLKSVAMLLSVDESAAQTALCSRVLAAQGDVMEKSHNVEQARRGRDAFAKVCHMTLSQIYL